MSDIAAKLEKAYLIMMQPSPTGIGAPVGEVHFQFNPKEYTVQKSASWTTRPAQGAAQTAMPQFTGADPRSITLELFLDATEDPVSLIEQQVENLFSCCTPLADTIVANAPSPPFVMFGWGRTMSVTAYVKSVSVKYTMFGADGAPLRATCNITLQEIPSAMPRQNPTSGGLTALRSHTVVAGDTLQSIAYQEYGTPTVWRAIAAANGIDDPMRVPSGANLLLPPESEAAQFA